MFREDLESREEEIIRTLSTLPEGFVVIGGYATSALSSHRFSVDCDIVISRKNAKEFRGVLKKEKYVMQKSAKGFDEAYGGSVEVYAKKIEAGKVSIDLFIDSLTSRSTKASWTYEYIKSNSTQATVSGARDSVNVAVPTKELLMSMKIHSRRDADIRDIVLLSESVDWSLVAKHVARGNTVILQKQLTNIISKIDQEGLGSSIRAAFELRRKIDPLISNCKKGLLTLKRSLEAL
jgi:hypothetical protein